jgi:hypothetical protein
MPAPNCAGGDGGAEQEIHQEPDKMEQQTQEAEVVAVKQVVIVQAEVVLLLLHLMYKKIYKYM